jgi:hypothetical protein
MTKKTARLKKRGEIWHIEELLAQPEQDNTQYLLDQVCRLTAENAMLKEKWNAQAEQYLKREPLSDEAINNIAKAYNTKAEQTAFEEGIIFAEISHEIRK